MQIQALLEMFQQQFKTKENYCHLATAQNNTREREKDKLKAT